MLRGPPMAELLQLLLLMGAAHVICDYPLQPGELSAAKRPPRFRPEGFESAMPWPVALGGHSLIHAGAVALITGSPWLGLAELTAHGAIDFLKCRGLYGMKVDQGLHLLCKGLWALLAIGAAS
jgi:hypothetical protein